MPMVTFRATGSTLGLITALQSTWRNMDCAVSCTSNEEVSSLFAVSCTMPYPWRIHGAAIYGNMDPIFYHQYTPFMLVYIYIYTSTMDPMPYAAVAVFCEAVSSREMWKLQVQVSAVVWLRVMVPPRTPHWHDVSSSVFAVASPMDKSWTIMNHDTLW